MKASRQDNVQDLRKCGPRPPCTTDTVIIFPAREYSSSLTAMNEFILQNENIQYIIYFKILREKAYAV